MSKHSLIVSVLIALALALTTSAAGLKEYGPIKDGDNLWAIAKLMRPDESIPVARMTRLLFVHNPQAFIGNNIDRLKKGAVLRVPDDLLSTTSTPVPKPHAVTPPQPVAAATKIEKKRSEQSTKPQQSGQKLPKDNQKLPTEEGKLSDLKQEIDRLRQENAAKDDAINSLRKELSALRQADSATKHPARETTSTPAPVSERTDDPPAEEKAEKPLITKPLPEPAPSQQAAKFTDQPAIDNNFLMLIGLSVGVSIMLLIVGFMWRQGALATKLLERSEQFTELRASSAPAAPAKQTETLRKESTEVLLTKADAELVNANYQQAEVLLQQALANDTSRDDIKLKLLHIYHAQKNQHKSEETNRKVADARHANITTSEKPQQVGQAAENVQNQMSTLETIKGHSENFFKTLQQIEAGLAADRDDQDHIEETNTKLELAHACVDMGDLNRAQRILNEVIQEGTQSQRESASTLIMHCKNRLLNLG